MLYLKIALVVTSNTVTSTFNAAKKLFYPSAPEIVTVSIDVPASKKKKARELELPAAIQVRFVKVILSTGKIEVLATSLLDENEISIDESH